jgi:hypothetical protein
VLNNTNPTTTFSSGTLVVNNGDTFYATMTPITYSGVILSSLLPTAFIFTYRYTSPFGVFDSFTLNGTSNTPSTFTPFSSPTQTVNIQAVNLAVYEIVAFC